MFNYVKECSQLGLLTIYALIFSPIYPLGIIFTVFTLSISYWINKVTILMIVHNSVSVFATTECT